MTASKKHCEWLIACDESGTKGTPYYGFGALFMPWPRRGDFTAMLNELRELHGHHNEMKWKRVHQQSIAFCKDVVEKFFFTPWLAFHCIVIRKALIDKELHGRDYDLAWRRHFSMFLNRKMTLCFERQPECSHDFRVWVDPIQSRYMKAAEATEMVGNNVVRKRHGAEKVIKYVRERDSKEAQAIQLCDLLLGAVLNAWRQKASSQSKFELQQWIAEHLGWKDLQADTRPAQKKFNIWYWVPKKHPREVAARRIMLRYPGRQ